MNVVDNQLAGDTLNYRDSLAVLRLRHVMDATLGERELDVMGVLWQSGPGTVSEVRERLSTADLAYNTVLTILRNLESKGFVGHTTEGRFFRYYSAITEQTVRGTALGRLVNKLFRGSPIDVVTHLVESERISDAELRALQELLTERLATAETSAVAVKQSTQRLTRRKTAKQTSGRSSRERP